MFLALMLRLWPALLIGPIGVLALIYMLAGAVLTYRSLTHHGSSPLAAALLILGMGVVTILIFYMIAAFFTATA
jgi:hypothetical protein